MSSSSLRDLLERDRIARLIGAHNAVGSLLIEAAGFDAVWASGLEISASMGVPDTNILSMSEVLAASAVIARCVSIPVLADCDSGFGNVNNVIYMVESYERAGIAGVCIEDKTFPKVNSFIAGRQELEPRATFAAKVRAATVARRSRDFVVVARLEALIAGMGMDEALARARLYEAAGADALLIHSKSREPDEVIRFRQLYDGALPLVVVPTSYADVSAQTLQSAGFAAVVYANQLLRSAVTAMTCALDSIRLHDSTAALEDHIASLADVFDLQGVGDSLARQRQLESFGDRAADEVIGCSKLERIP